MPKLHYIIRSLLADKAISLFLFFEMFVFFVITNITIGEYNSRTMLYDPIEQFISKQGFLVYRDNDEGLTSITDDLSQIIGTKETRFLEVKQYADPNISFVILPDEVYDKLRLPVSKGKLFALGNSNTNCQAIITQNDQGYKCGDRIQIENGAEIEISAVLTDPTYIMRLKYYKKMSYEDMYYNYEKDYYDGIPAIYTCESEFKKLNADKRFIIVPPVSIVAFEQLFSEEEYRSIKDKLKAADMYLIDNKDINERSKKILSDDFKRFIPSAFVFGVITLIGILSCSIIGTRTSLKKLALFYCCGATIKDCIIIAVGRITIIILFSGLSACITILLFKMLNLFNLIGFVFSFNNVIVTFSIILLSTAISTIAPIVLISKNDPHNLLIDTKQE